MGKGGSPETSREKATVQTRGVDVGYDQGDCDRRAKKYSDWVYFEGRTDNSYSQAGYKLLKKEYPEQNEV